MTQQFIQNIGTLNVSLYTTDYIKYTSKFYFGSNGDLANLVYDSQSDWTIVTTTECETCSKKSYNQKNSKTATRGWDEEARLVQVSIQLSL